MEPFAARCRVFKEYNRYEIVNMTIWFVAIAAMMILIAASLVLKPFGGESKDTANGRFAIAIVAVAIATAAGLYLVIGRPDVLPTSTGSLATTSPRASTAESDEQKEIGSVGSLIDGLAARLESQPDDAEGWILLAKSYKHLGRVDDASAAYARARALGASDASLDDLSVDGSDEASARISGRVSVIGDPPAAGSTVFIIAKPADGSPMPLAVLRKPASELPFEFALSDEHSMVQGAGLGAVDTVIISVKVSASGDALQAANGYEVHSGPVKVAGAEHLELVIDPTNTINRKQ